MAKKTCPRCGTPLESSRSFCPNCKTPLRKPSPLTPFLVVGGIVAVIIIVFAVLLLTSPAPSAPLPVPELTMLPTPGAAAQNPAPPSCTIALAGSKMPPSSVQIRVMTSTCTAGDVTELRVMVNGARKGTLGSAPGTSGTFPGTSGTNNVMVVAKYANGAEGIVFQNPAL